MKNIGLLFITFIVSNCQPKNVEFNPFDNEFRFHRNFQLSEYDQIMAECGYWNLSKRKDDLEIYYQFF